jgi:predicted carbohydrate-binding protein with CBM5 and CBM33 domain
MQAKILTALGTILVIVLALVAADQATGWIERMRARKVAEKNAAAAAAAPANAQ